MRTNRNDFPVELRNLAFYHRLYPWSLIGMQLQYRVKVRCKWSQWVDVPVVEAKNSPRILHRHDLADYRQKHREKRRALGQQNASD